MNLEDFRATSNLLFPVSWYCHHNDRGRVMARKSIHPPKEAASKHVSTVRRPDATLDALSAHKHDLSPRLSQDFTVVFALQK